MTKFKYIFDLDGTLYRFDKNSGGTFVKSRFYQDIKENVYRFFAKEFKVSRKQAIQMYEKLMEKFKGEVSLGIEKTYGIDRYRYFNATWNLEPKKYFETNDNLMPIMEQIAGRAAILTNAPLVWTKRTLSFLGIDRYLKEDAIFTGEGDIRKPNPQAFSRILTYFNCPPETVFSIGDQEQTDIIPAKTLGMKTIIVGSKSSFADYSIKTIDDFSILIKKIEKEAK